MNSRLLLLVTAVAVHWQIAASLLAPKESSNGVETERIVRGQPAEAGQFPYAVAMFKNDRFACTGSIINNRTILTAAHCVQRGGVTDSPGTFHFIANVDKSQPGQRIEIIRVIPHPQYDERSISNDVAVMITKDLIQMNENVSSVALAKDAPELVECDYAEYNTTIVMGWGSTNPLPIIGPIFPMIPNILQYGVQRVVCRRQCRTAEADEDGKICATGKWGRDDDGKITLWSAVCSGDSGGPLVEVIGIRKYRQFGVTSYGLALGCGLFVPEVFADVAYYIAFIRESAEGDVEEM